MRLNSSVLLFSLAMLFASPAWAQGAPALSSVPTEALHLRAHSHHVTGLYTASGFVFGCVPPMAIAAIAFLTGDTTRELGVISLFTLPALGGLGLSLLAVAVGYDVSLGAWDGSRLHRTGPPSPSEVDRLSATATALYVTGGIVMALGAIPTIVVAAYNQYVFNRTPRGEVIDTVVLIGPVGAIGLGMLLIMTGLGIDHGARGYAGALSLPSITPLEGGAMITSAGAF